MTGTELWLPVPGHDPYIVSDQGRIARPLKGSINSSGYNKVHLGRGNQFYVHQVVMLAFAGPCPPGFNVDHLDFSRTHNARENLRYMAKQHNDFRWKRYEDNASPEELAEIDAKYAAWEAEACAAIARGDADPWEADRAAAS